MRGRRCPEIAAGDTHEHLHKVYATRNTLVMASIPESASEPERYLIMADFERRRAHLFSVVTLKLSHMSQVPYGLFGVAHPIPEKAVKCYQKAIGIEDLHRLTRK